jgi:hypothetical protein
MTKVDKVKELLNPSCKTCGYGQTLFHEFACIASGNIIMMGKKPRNWSNCPFLNIDNEVKDE